MRVLITGIGGRLGRMLAERLASAGHEVIGIDKRATKDGFEGVEMHTVDLRKRAAEDVFRKTKPDTVIHMGTVTHLVVQSEDRYRINLQGTRAVFDYSRAHGVAHVVFVGRHTYYGAAPDSPLYHTEDEPPISMQNFPELADLVAADLYAGSALWRTPELATTVLRMCYTLGPTGHGTLATFLRGARVPSILGFDPLFQFMHERDVVSALVTAVEKRPRGVFNVAGPQPLPLSVLVRAVGRRPFPVPEMLFAGMLGRFGLPKLSRGAIDHIKYPVIVDDAAFRKATGYRHEVPEDVCTREYKDAFPAVSG